MDEKGCRLTIHKQPMVLAQKGAKRVHMVAPEHAENVTVAACVNALGNPTPPMILFKGKKLKTEFTDNLPAGSLVKMAPKGSMTTSLFIDFIHHLGKYKTADKCLLVFDGASCHLDYQIVEAADKENIVLYCLPSNTTHELQPLDKSVNKSFEHHWDQETLLFLYQNPDKKLTKARFNTIFSRVWSKCMTHDNIVNGFRATGLYPYNPDAIPEEAYAPSVLTEISEISYRAQSCTLDNNLAQETSPIPGPSGMNSRLPLRNFSDNSSDSDRTNVEDLIISCPTSPSLMNRTNVVDYIPSYPASPSLLTEVDHSLPVFYNSNTTTNHRLVDYSSSDSGSNIQEPPIQLQETNTITRRPIIYSSDTDTSVEDQVYFSELSQ